ncbi:hypothetical protein [Bosea sp. 124]|uniref:hypothetical protein n=1 Tax=Bosea sp. 124 TaxID=2135642 RepID=UPI000D4E28D6|nr:hypothetical protein [Bosea sp. 124]PTM40941.1 hypothetical protein C8D03_2474 [Bosea sp. 124]
MHTNSICAFAFAICMLGSISGAQAQEGCKTANSSCSQMNASCEQKCQNGNNPGACVARLCAVSYSGCKANGVWKGAAATACWKTNNRS